MKRLYSFLIVALATTFVLVDNARALEVVNVTHAAPEVRLAVQAAAGLANRDAPNVYVVMDDDDAFWLSEIVGDGPLQTTSVSEFVQDAAKRYGVILYPPGRIDDTLDTVVTLAGVLDAIPMVAVEPASGVHIKVDARSWSKARALAEAEAVLAKTSSLAVQESAMLAKGELVDFIVKNRLFTNYLPLGCVPMTAEHTYLKRIVDNAPWRKPVRVYGYNTQVRILGGFTFEAETDCLPTLGQIATQHARNLAFWSSREPIEKAFTQTSASDVSYDPSVSYVGLVYGDMDNIDFVQGFARKHMEIRADRCLKSAAANSSNDCFPLTWTLSPNLIRIAPDILRWYMRKAEKSGNDWFIFPPSGTLYSYPGMFNDADQETYVRQMDADAALMDTSGSIHWEWFSKWTAAFGHYFPRFAGTGHKVKSFFLNNVPWPIPIASMALRGETYRVIGGPEEPVVAFKPTFNWAPGNPSGGLDASPKTCANMLGLLPKGSVQYIYTIQTTDVADLFDLADNLPEHVRLVSYEQLVSLALQKEAYHSHHQDSTMAQQ